MFRLMLHKRRSDILIAQGILETEGIAVEIADIENISLEELESKLINADGLPCRITNH